MEDYKKAWEDSVNYANKIEIRIGVLEAEKELTEKQRVHWWRLACGRLGTLHDVIKIQPNVDTPEEYHAWLENFILDAIAKLDAKVD